MGSNKVLIHKEPLIHQTNDDHNPNDIITRRHDALIAQQDTETFKDFQKAMNKLLLPRDENNGWDVYQNTILKRVGTLAKTILADVVVPEQQSTGHCCVLFGVDLLIDTDLVPVIIDVNGVANPPTKLAFTDI